MTETQNSTLKPQPSIGAWELFRIWLLIGLQSFGGGSATLLLIRQEMVVKRGWVGDEEYTRFFTLCQIAPGINLIALSILIGRKLAGVGGIMACLLGMLLPSVAVTTLLTAGFSAVQNWPPMQAALRGIVPATAGLSLVLAIQLGKPLIKRSMTENKISVGMSLGFIAACSFVLAFLKLPVVLVLLVAALLGAILFARFEEMLDFQKTVVNPVPATIEIEGIEQGNSAPTNAGGEK